MKSTNFVLFLTAVGLSCCFAEKDSSENENRTKPPPEGNETKKTDPDFKSMDKNPHGRQRQPEYLITPDQRLLIDPRIYYSQFANEGSPIHPLGFPNNGRQNILFSDYSGKYNLELQNLNQGTPTNFQAALGAISSHIINQKNSPEYIPYPPNGDPYNYPAYRGHPRATDPPVVRAYERASNSNYHVQPVDFDQQNPRRFYNDYQPGFSNQFQNFGSGFYNNPGFFNDGAFYPELRRSSYAPVDESRWYNQGEEYRRPIK